MRLRHRKAGVSLARYGGVRVVVRVAETIVASLANGVATPIVPVPPWSIGPPQTGPGVRRPRPIFWAMPNAQATTGSTAHSTASSSVQSDILGVDAGLPSVRIRRHRTGGRQFGRPGLGSASSGVRPCLVTSASSKAPPGPADPAGAIPEPARSSGAIAILGQGGGRLGIVTLDVFDLRSASRCEPVIRRRPIALAHRNSTCRGLPLYCKLAPCRRTR